MEPCQFISKCPMFNKFRNQVVKDFWANSYCENNSGARCARKRLRDAGKGPKDVPITLLPNGMHLAEFEDTERDWENVTGKACMNLRACSVMLDRLQDPESKVFLGRRYCLGSGTQDCQRKRMIDSGTDPPEIAVTLLPNGEHLLSLQR